MISPEHTDHPKVQKSNSIRVKWKNTELLTEENDTKKEKYTEGGSRSSKLGRNIKI